MTTVDLSRPARDRPSAGPRRSSTARRTAPTLLAALLLLVTAGCGLRLDTPAPAELVPDEVEVVRERVATDALAVEALGDELAAATADPAVAAVLTQVARAAQTHAEALGGAYVAHPEATDEADGTDEDAASASGTPDVADGGASTAATPAPTTAPARTVADLLALLTETAASARADAASVPDAELARLVGSVAVSRWQLADTVVGLVPDVVESTAASLGQPFAVPDAVPVGLTSADLSTLVQAEDALGLAYEVAAARSGDDLRASRAARATVHRGRAQAWAQAAELEANGLDPRRASYVLPPAFTAVPEDPAAGATALTTELALLEADLATSYASALADVAAGERGPFVDAVLDATREHVRMGIAAATLPGLPEQQPAG
ncbi:DUF4439 domain-containing protein [Actinotalea subterranea]|uniref:DUF4439 domain-containing protein n=1 Tax=Actinotalea subterranea TaxID=2607497 RepID=UPI0011ED56BD|nr:DUF4439 domain-containing protein [Actinotalea subterranea]